MGKRDRDNRQDSDRELERQGCGELSGRGGCSDRTIAILWRLNQTGGQLGISHIGKANPRPRSTALVPLAISASVVSVCRTFTFVANALWETVQPDPLTVRTLHRVIVVGADTPGVSVVNALMA